MLPGAFPCSNFPPQICLFLLLLLFLHSLDPLELKSVHVHIFKWNRPRSSQTESRLLFEIRNLIYLLGVLPNSTWISPSHHFFLFPSPSTSVLVDNSFLWTVSFSISISLTSGSPCITFLGTGCLRFWNENIHIGVNRIYCIAWFIIEDI